MAKRHNGTGRRKQQLKTMAEVIACLGGDAALRELTNSHQNNITNWKNAQCKFPAKFYLVMTQALEERGHRADPELWGILPP
jgi:hypothetical protein